MRQRGRQPADGLGSYVLAAACLAAGVLAVVIPAAPGPERTLHWACGGILMLLGINRILVTRWRLRREARSRGWEGRDV